MSGYRFVFAVMGNILTFFQRNDLHFLYFNFASMCKYFCNTLYTLFLYTVYQSPSRAVMKGIIARMSMLDYVAFPLSRKEGFYETVTTFKRALSKTTQDDRGHQEV